jgi:hypothetical protein
MTPQSAVLLCKRLVRLVNNFGQTPDLDNIHKASLRSVLWAHHLISSSSASRRIRLTENLINGAHQPSLALGQYPQFHLIKISKRPAGSEHRFGANEHFGVRVTTVVNIENLPRFGQQNVMIHPSISSHRLTSLILIRCQ